MLGGRAMFLKTHVVAVLLSASILEGCGTFVPEVRDFPNNGTYAENNALVMAIVQSINCELETAVTRVLNEKGSDKNSSEFLRRWGAEVALTLQLEEKSTISPTGVWSPPSPATAIFTLGGGLSGSADATRIDKVNYYYKVSDLYGKNGSCVRSPNSPTDSLLIQSDLKLAEWLDVMVNGVDFGDITSIGKQNVLSHEITFEVDTSGNITPALKLVRGSVDQSGSLFSTSRNRKHDLLITFGPLDTTQSGTFLVPIAEQTHIASQLSSGITAGFHNAMQQ
jgi:hypothetical protein